MSIGQTRDRLIAAAKSLAASDSAETLNRLCQAAIEYAKAKMRGWERRDKWKARRRLGER